MKQKNIFLIDGASGTGKSDFVEYINSLNNKSGFVIKSTTRKIRDYEKKNAINLDLKFCTQLKFDSLKLEYHYEYEKHQYGFSKKELNDLIEKCENIFLIIRNVPLMRKLKKEFKEQNVVSVWVYSDISKIKERLREQDCNEEQIKFRVSRIEKTYKDYVLNSAFFDEVVINNSDKEAYHQLIDSLIKKYSN
ncbi:MAG: Guanylate kinase [Saprospiraceae bacterium]|jgi:guanylate kinase|nr:Guanylate kinase [Saprospiraceae bacterium]